jgi:hypothetical protein
MTVETIERIRQRNFLWLFEQFKEEFRKDWPNEPDRGMLRRFADRLGMDQIYVSQIKNGGKKEEGGNGRIIGPQLARRIESALNLAEGWMDTNHQAPAEVQDEGLADVLNTVRGLYEHSPEATRAALIKVMGAIVTGKPIETIVEKEHAK